MEQQNSNAVTTVTEETRVTQELLLDYLKTMNKGLTEQQTKQFLAVAGTFGLNPWKREVYAVTYKNKDGSTDMSIVTGYETYIKRAELNPNYDGFDIEFKGGFKRGKITKQGKNGPWQVDALVPDGTVSCVCTVYRKDRAHPTREEVFFDEYDQGNSMWQSKPRTMLKKVAIVSAFRKAFPFDFGGMPYTNDELPDNMTGADKLNAQGHVEVTVDEQPEPPKEQPKTAAKTAAKTQDEKDANWIAMCDELRERNPEIFDNYMKQHNVPDLAEIKGSKDRHKLYTDIKATIDFAEKEAENG
ncbi:phage recombination protein Bet [uncultured Fibrobacter sp.]|uniref:phage recombination protein Bet n=1 Tax=uncultured Fibrobacter sp. TaxID=261512 RepID=UPI0025F108D5|nr:phage recombination protein Bet [uncultured Fibrobacter sp.]